MGARTRTRARAVAPEPAPKRPFDIDEAFVKLREATRDLPKAEMFALRDEGYTTVFEQLVSCILSIRTLDEVAGPAARRLFAVARSPAQIAALSVDDIFALVEPVQYAYGKSGQIRTIAAFTAETYGDDLPADYDVLTSLKGVAPTSRWAWRAGSRPSRWTSTSTG
jgi:endonuclease-3